MRTIAEIEAERAALLIEMKQAESTGSAERAAFKARQEQRAAEMLRLQLEQTEERAAYEASCAARSAINGALQQRAVQLKAERIAAIERDNLTRTDIVSLIDGLADKIAPVLAESEEGRALLDVIHIRRRVRAVRATPANDQPIQEAAE